MIHDDALLVVQVLAGEKSAFGSLIDWHRPGTVAETSVDKTAVTNLRDNTFYALCNDLGQSG
jgi:hypothetical protein